MPTNVGIQTRLATPLCTLGSIEPLDKVTKASLIRAIQADCLTLDAVNPGRAVSERTVIPGATPAG